MKILQQDIVKPYQMMVAAGGGLLDSPPPFSVEMKRQEKAYGLANVLADVHKLKHPNDGLIFTPVRLAYSPGTCHRL